MRLAPRLVLAFGLLVSLSVAGLGTVLRQEQVQDATALFDAQVKHACERVALEVEREGQRDQKLLGAACHSGELVDRVQITLDRGDFSEHRMRFAQLVPPQRAAFDLDELVLATGNGEIIGADPHRLLTQPKSEIEVAFKDKRDDFHFRKDAPKAIVSHCTVNGRGGGVLLLGARHLDPVVARIANNLDVVVHVGKAKPGKGSAMTDAGSSDVSERPRDTAQATCNLRDGLGDVVPITVTKSKSELIARVEHTDQTILFAALGSTGIALLLAVLVARSLGRPLGELADEARKVATGDARPLRVRGSGEVRDLVVAFDRMLSDLKTTRRRLSDASRIAAWREVARRVAHEVKNPLAPIRAAVETLRRLRARNDAAFDEYFDEATRTVLDEVHRISNIVTEFTNFARLPRPKPQTVDLADLANAVLTLQRARAGEVKVDLDIVGKPPPVEADRDQVVQVLTNLVQNAIEAVKGGGGERVVVSVEVVDTEHVAVVVSDDGPGIDASIRDRLFEPYATTKSAGTGLGLAIAQRIALEHGGDLLLDTSRLGRGATFRLTLTRRGPDLAADEKGVPEPTLPLD